MIGKVTDVAVVNREERYVTTTASLFGFFPVHRRAHYRGPVPDVAARQPAPPQQPTDNGRVRLL